MTGWDFDYTDVAGRPPPGGLLLKDIHHWGHNFCKDLRLIGIRLWMDEVTPANRYVRTTSHFLPLSNPPFEIDHQQLLPPAVISTTSMVGDVTRFNSYFTSSAFALRGDFTLGTPYVSTTWPNCEFARMVISQRFMFSPYNNSPRHEPSGGLMAARCHPMTRFHFQPNDALDRSQNRWRMNRIRFDYRIHLFLDRNYASATAQPNIGNQAGLFRDADTAYSVVVTQGVRTVLRALPGVHSQFTAQGFSNTAFESVEKPLVLEVATYGLNQGSTGIRDARTWDNIHWWGARGPGSPMISAPGAFHAAHIHWRWGGAGYSGRSRYEEIDGGGSARTARVQVDPNCWMQTIRVAVVQNTPARDPNTGVALETLCREDWSTLFTGASPANIENGGDIVLWYSSEVAREQQYTDDHGASITASLVTPATVFLHGIFFAHEAEQTSITTPIGVTTAEYRPRDRATIIASPAWERLS